MRRRPALVAALALVLTGCGDKPPVTVEARAAARPTVMLLAHELPPSTTTTHPPSTTTSTAPPEPSTTTSTLAPPPLTTAPSGGRCGGWAELIAAHFPPEQTGTACRVMMCESGGNPTAQNPRSTASGLWQFLDSTWESTTGTAAPASGYDPGTQTAAAAALWSRSGWGPWSCY